MLTRAREVGVVNVNWSDCVFTVGGFPHNGHRRDNAGLRAGARP